MEQFDYLASNLIVQEAECTVNQARGIGEANAAKPGEFGETQAQQLKQETDNK
jgi:hypothetical protein